MQNGNLSKAEMTTILKQMGIQQNYRPYQSKEEDSGTIHLQTSKLPTIEEGYLSGHDVTVYDNQTVLVWTHRVNKVTRLAETHRLKFQRLDSEALLYVPVPLLSVVLPAFNIKTRRVLTPEQRVVNVKRLEAARAVKTQGGATV